MERMKNNNLIRRYKTGEHFLYDKEFEVLQRKSEILNPKIQTEKFIPIDDLGFLADTFSFKEELLILRNRELNGAYDQNGKLMNSGMRYPIEIIRIQKLNRGATKEEAQQIASGQFYSEKALKHEAVIDVLKNELAELKRLITLAEKKREDELRPCLPRGPRGTTKGSYPVCYVDGQRTGRDTTGELFISDKRSPYNGMRMTDYKVVVHKFMASLVRRTDMVSKDKWPKWPDGVEKVGAEKSKIVEG